MVLTDKELFIGFCGVGMIFCGNMHMHELHGDAAKHFTIDESTRMEITPELGKVMYNQLASEFSESSGALKQVMSGKVAYIVSMYEDDFGELQRVLLLYSYNNEFHTVLARVKK